MTRAILCAARCRAEQPNEAAPGYRLCWSCHGWLPKHLAELAGLADDLEQALSRSNVVNGEVVSGSSAQHPSELNTAAAAARWQIHHDMVSTVRLILEERGLTSAPPDSIEAMARWLSRHADWLSAHPSAGERANGAADWLSAARNAINPDPPKRVKIGPCVVKDCPGLLTATVRAQDSLLPSAITCSWWEILAEEGRAQVVEDGGEEHRWTPSSWHALGRRMRSAA